MHNMHQLLASPALAQAWLMDSTCRHRHLKRQRAARLVNCPINAEAAEHEPGIQAVLAARGPASPFPSCSITRTSLIAQLAALQIQMRRIGPYLLTSFLVISLT